MAITMEDLKKFEKDITKEQRYLNDLICRSDKLLTKLDNTDNEEEKDAIREELSTLRIELYTISHWIESLTHDYVVMREGMLSTS